MQVHSSFFLYFSAYHKYPPPMYKPIIVFAYLYLLSFSVSTFAQGDLYVTPNRVILEGRKMNEVLSLANTGDKAATYSISFVQRRMNEDGSFTSIDAPDEGAPFADPYLRIYPRQVTLEPKEGQSIVLQVRRTVNMPDGEYRSHIYFRSENDYAPLSKETNDTLKTVSVKLIPIFGISIPIIIRIGNVSATATLNDLSLDLKNQKNELTFNLNREGNASLFGDLKVEYIQENKKPVEIGAMNGVAVYTNIKKRKIAIKVNIEDISLNKGKIKVSYLSREDASVLAEAEIKF
jgi:hypothetical protein